MAPPDIYIQQASLAATTIEVGEEQDSDIVESAKKAPTVIALAEAIQAAGYGVPAEMLGYGHYGAAFALQDHPGLVMKITTDPTEIQVGAYLTSKKLAHVAEVRGSWRIRGADNKPLKMIVMRSYGTPSGDVETVESDVQLGLLVMERLDRDADVVSTIQDSPLTKTVVEVKQKYGLYPSDLERLSRNGARRRLETGCVAMSKALYAKHDEVCSDVASGLEELYELGVFAVDVHGGNVGRDPESYAYKVFDVGTASSPTVRVKNLPGKRHGATPAASENYANAACDAVNVSVIVVPSAAPTAQRLVAAKGSSPKAQHTHPVVAAEEKVQVAYEKTEAAYEAGIPWVKLERDPARYGEALKEAEKHGSIEGPAGIYKLVGGYLAKQDQEVFLVVLLDIHRKLRGVCEVARGQRARVTVAVADIMRPVLESGAAAFVVVHNHPSGKAKPSDADKELTKAIEDAAKVYEPDVKMLDHVIVGMGEYYSFDEKKMFKGELPSKGASEKVEAPVIEEVSAKKFRTAFEAAMDGNPYTAFVSHYSLKELEPMRRFLSSTGKAGVAAHDHGDGRVEGTALFNAGGRDGMGQVLLRHAVKHAKVNYLECFGEGLRMLYERNGFSVMTADPFNVEYAPKNWNYEQFGRPNYYTLRRIQMPEGFAAGEATEKMVEEMVANPGKVREQLVAELKRMKPGITQSEIDFELGLIEATLGF